MSPLLLTTPVIPDANTLGKEKNSSILWAKEMSKYYFLFGGKFS